MFEKSLLSHIVFPAPEATYTADDYPEELIWIPRQRQAVGSRGAPPPVDKPHIPCLLMRYPSARFLILYFHSNAEDLGLARPFCAFIREQFQVHVLVVEYPGYGICSGVPTSESVLENARAAMAFATDTLMWPLDSIKFFGRSIGTGPAMVLASEHRAVAGLVLVAPFLSIQELFRDRIGPLASFVEDIFRNKDMAPEVRAPTLVIHGQKDGIVPVAHGRAMFDLFRSRKLLVLPPDMEHNSNLLFNIQYFILPMFQFFSLPDYVFQDLEVPAWVFDPQRGQGRWSDLMTSPADSPQSMPEEVRQALEQSASVKEMAHPEPPPVRQIPKQARLGESRNVPLQDSSPSRFSLWCMSNTGHVVQDGDDQASEPGLPRFWKFCREASCRDLSNCCFTVDQKPILLAPLPVHSATDPMPSDPKDEELLSKPMPFRPTRESEEQP
eukprot:TRINITY_DN37212_c0_g1_i1.p1 TRINITY_DN37212_c0_g1~~TRINITY_DN37212_c0_g1_i1.p1  ORF type:complete len:440 (-),score=82.98 TRINITY_DN37212_c0_g1_i1:12-1331(-)